MLLWWLRMMDKVISLLEKHERWRGRECINLTPSENVMNPMVRSLLSSDLGQRYSSRDQFYMGARFVDEIELESEEKAKQVFSLETSSLHRLSSYRRINSKVMERERHMPMNFYEIAFNFSNRGSLISLFRINSLDLSYDLAKVFVHTNYVLDSIVEHCCQVERTFRRYLFD